MQVRKVLRTRNQRCLNGTLLGRLAKSRYLTGKLIGKSARNALRLAESISWRKTREGWLHGVVLGSLEAYVGNMQSEYNVSRGRIDFRHKTTNPVLIELVVPRHGNEQCPSMNTGELAKLCRVPYTKGKKRILLILDVARRKPIPREKLKEAYARTNAGRGRFSRNVVTVMYFHRDEEYQFRWKPYKVY